MIKPRIESLTIRSFVLLVLASSEVGGTSSGKFVGKLWLIVIIAIDNLVMCLSLVGVCESLVQYGSFSRMVGRRWR